MRTYFIIILLTTFGIILQAAQVSSENRQTTPPPRPISPITEHGAGGPPSPKKKNGLPIDTGSSRSLLNDRFGHSGTQSPPRRTTC